MSVRERDPLTGHQTTGHEWNGITELNTRVPRPVWWFIGITHVWALVVWIMLPTWPLLWTYTPGILHTDQRREVEAQVSAANSARCRLGEPDRRHAGRRILADPALMAHVDQTAPALFGDNCAGCHGFKAAGGPGFPSLVDGDWLWGGTRTRSSRRSASGSTPGIPTRASRRCWPSVTACLPTSRS